MSTKGSKESMKLKDKKKFVFLLSLLGLLSALGLGWG
jgi:hypothetical protein